MNFPICLKWGAHIRGWTGQAFSCFRRNVKIFQQNCHCFHASFIYELVNVFPQRERTVYWPLPALDETRCLCMERNRTWYFDENLWKSQTTNFYSFSLGFLNKDGQTTEQLPIYFQMAGTADKSGRASPQRFFFFFSRLELRLNGSRMFQGDWTCTGFSVLAIWVP